MNQSERGRILEPSVLSSVSPLFSGSRRQLGSPSRGAGVIRGTWGSGSRYSRTGPNAFQYFYSSHCVLLHTCRRSAPLPQMRNYHSKEMPRCLGPKKPGFFSQPLQRCQCSASFLPSPIKGPGVPIKSSASFS